MGPTPPPPRLVRFVEPTEGAFSLVVPAGWRAQGGVVRGPGDPRPWYRVMSPGGGAELRGSDPRVPKSFVDPRYGTMGMFPMPGAVPRPYAPPAAFAETYALGFALERGAPGLTVTGRRDAEAMLRDDPRPESRPRVQMMLQQGAEFAGVTFVCPERGLSGLVDVVQIRAMMPVGMVWSPFVTALIGPTAQWAHVEATLLHIVRSYVTDPAWQRLQTQLQQAQHEMAMETIATGTRVLQTQARSGMEAIQAHAQRAHAAAQASAEVSAMQADAWRAQQAADDERHRRAVNAAQETVDLRDPTTGQVYRGAPAGYATYWTDGAERVVASEGSENPDPTRLTQAEDLDDVHGSGRRG